MTTAEPRDQRLCTARRSTDGELCQKYAVQGATVCMSHGAAAPQVRAAARRRLATERAKRTLAEVDVDPITDPIQAFADLVSETVALKTQLAAEVAALQGQGSRKTEEARAALSAYERALDRSAKLLGRWVELGLLEAYQLRRIELQEAQRSLLAIAVSQVLARLDLSDEQQAKAILDLGDTLRELSDSTGTWLPSPWLSATAPGLEASISAIEQDERRRRLEAAGVELLPSTLDRVFDRIDDMAARIAGQPRVIDVEADEETPPPPAPVVDPKTGKPMPDASKLDPPPPPPPQPDEPSEPRRRVRLDEVRIPVPGEQYIPPWGGWRGAAPPPPPDDEEPAE